MKKLGYLVIFAVLTACGADGEPEPVEPGVGISGQVKIGVSGTL